MREHSKGREVPQQIEQLEYCHKKNLTEDGKNKLKELNNVLKILDSCKIASEIVYAKQKIFDFRDKPRKNLAHLLSEVPT